MRFHLNTKRTRAVKARHGLGGTKVAPPKALRENDGRTRGEQEQHKGSTRGTQESTSQSLGLRAACRWLVGGFGVALRWLRVASPDPSSFCILPSSFAPMWLWVALTGLSWRRPPQTYKKPESIRPASPASGCPPTGLVPPWTCPIPIEPPQSPIFDQPSSSRPRASLWARRPNA